MALPTVMGKTEEGSRFRLPILYANFRLRTLVLRVFSNPRMSLKGLFEAGSFGRLLFGMISYIARRRRGGGNCMVRRMIASRIFVAGGLVCSNVSGLFVEPSSWPQWSPRVAGL